MPGTVQLYVLQYDINNILGRPRCHRAITQRAALSVRIRVYIFTKNHDSARHISLVSWTQQLEELDHRSVLPDD